MTRLPRRAATALLAAVFAGGLAGGLTGCGTSAGAQAGGAAAAVRSPLHGTVPDLPTPRPQFTLTDTAGQRYDFAARTSGRVTLLFWGYTRCPDTCPAVLHDIALALRRLPPAVRSQVTVVFVTADPARDTGAVLRRWLNDIDPSFIGLTGTAAAIAQAEEAVGVPHAVREPGKGSDYAVDHYSGVIAYGRDDRVAVKYPSNAVVGDYTADLPLLVREEPSR